MAIILVYGDFEIPAGGKTENFFFIQTPEGRVPWSKKIAPAIDRIVQATVPEPHNKPYQRPKTITGKRVIDGVEKEYSVIRSWPRERKRRAHWSIEGDTEGAYLKLWNIGNHNNYVWNGTDFEKVKGREENPDWSRESMKTILAWGWVSPTGQDHIGQRKDKTHDAMAYELGLGTWVQAVKAGWVRYIIFSDGHMGVTLIITPATLAAARKLVDKPEVATVSFEWLVDGKIEQSGVLTVKSALAAIRVKGRMREQNPPYHGGGIYTGNVFSWGFISPTGMVMDGANDDSAPRNGGTTHDKLARAYGLGGEGKALAKGYVRYLSGMMKSGQVEVAATIAEPWAGPAKALRKYIDVGLHGPVAHILDLDFVEKSGYTHYASIAVVGEEKIKAVLSAVGRGEDPADVRERMRVESRGEERNPPMGLRRQNLLWGLMSPDGKLWLGKPGEQEHNEIAHRVMGPNYKEDSEWPLYKLITKGWIRFVVDDRGSLWCEIRNRDKAIYATLIKLINRPEVVGRVIVDLEEVGKTMEFEDAQDAINELRAYNRTANPLPLTDEHRRQARGNKFNVLVEMTPMEFLRLTTVDDRQIKEIMDNAQPLEVYNKAAAAGTNIIPCFLTLDINGGVARVIGHEGRHRAAALFMNGEEGVGLPVYLRVRDASQAQANTMLDSLPGGRDKWLWDTTYLWGWDEVPDMIVGQFNSLVKVPKSRFKVVEPYVQERARKARGL